MTPRPIAELVPHRDAMLLLDELLSLDGDEALAAGRIGESHPLMRPEGFVDPLVAIELVAQAAAAMEGARRESSGEEASPTGLLVGVSDFELRRGLEPGERVTVRVRELERSRVFRRFEGEVRAEARLVGRGEVRLVVGEVACGGGRATAPPCSPRERRESLFPLESAERSASRGGDLLEATYHLNPDLPVFSGHFPNRPLLPGVALLAIAADPAIAQTGHETVARVSTARFGRAVPPWCTLTVKSKRRGSGYRAHLALSGLRSASADFSFRGLTCG